MVEPPVLGPRCQQPGRVTIPGVSQPAPRTVLEALTRPRLAAVGRELGLTVPAGGVKDAQIEALASLPTLDLPGLLRLLGRDELRAACRAHGLDDSGRSRPDLMGRLLEAAGKASAAPSSPVASAHRTRPEAGDIVQVRHRQYLVEEAVLGAPGEASRIVLSGLDDDNQGRRLEVLWEIELGGRILQPELHGPDTGARLDPPRAFSAYLNALRWNAVTATDARLFQAPFRAGIQLLGHQLTPLKRALDLPRANLFIADDVGLGKTVEAGLVLQELTLRQQVDFALVVCPASLCLQWRDEMERRFGLRFEIYNRPFVARRRQERGFAVNPWTTHNRFVVSYQLLRRPEVRDPLLHRLGDRARKSLLILDEAHTAAPASASVYAVDSRLTQVIRDVAPRFEHRLFLSATPHNGHSNSFSALLEILDPQRFNRGVKVERGQLDKVMVRRLKADLRELGVEGYPVRRLVQLDLTHEAGSWRCTALSAAEPVDLGAAEPVELRLSILLAEYTALLRPQRNKRGQLVFINLQKRLLSGVKAFYRTLRLHADHVGKDVSADSQLGLAAPEDDEYGPDEETAEAVAGAEIAAASRHLADPQGRARQILDEMLQLAERWRHLPDAKTLALLAWIREYQCTGGPAIGSKAPWSDRRVIVFTEYGDTERYLHRMLAAALDGTDDAERRILKFHGGMSDETRDDVQRAFNAPPDEHPVRILLATDAAREGVNLQGHCADLFHFDIPWNPAHLEQRNGRIDRTLQPEPEVRCHYFSYTQREEDRVLEVVVAKVQTIQKELGSLSAVLMDRYAEILDQGIGPGSRAALDDAGLLAGRRETVRDELESERADLRKLKREIDDAGVILDRSQKILEFDPDLLRETVDAGLVLTGAGPLKPMPPEAGEPPAYRLPDLPESWQVTLDTLRPPRRAARTSPSGTGAPAPSCPWSSGRWTAWTARASTSTSSTRSSSGSSRASWLKGTARTTSRASRRCATPTAPRWWCWSSAASRSSAPAPPASTIRSWPWPPPGWKPAAPTTSAPTRARQSARPWTASTASFENYRRREIPSREFPSASATASAPPPPPTSPPSGCTSKPKPKPAPTRRSASWPTAAPSNPKPCAASSAPRRPPSRNPSASSPSSPWPSPPPSPRPASRSARSNRTATPWKAASSPSIRRSKPSRRPSRISTGWHSPGGSRSGWCICGRRCGGRGRSFPSCYLMVEGGWPGRNGRLNLLPTKRRTVKLSPLGFETVLLMPAVLYWTSIPPFSPSDGLFKKCNSMWSSHSLAPVS
jgi:hypothetical protein